MKKDREIRQDKTTGTPSSEALSRRQAIKRLSRAAVGAAGLAAGIAALPSKALASKCDNFMANCCGIGYADYEAYSDYYVNSYTSYGYSSYSDYYSSHFDYSSTHFAPDPSFYVSSNSYTSYSYRSW